MATIKSYTDLSQSKALSKILPLESADMIWYGIYRGMDGEHHLLSDEYNKFGLIAINKEFCKTLFRIGDEFVDWLPCWSLASLIGVIPKGEYIDFDLSFGGYQGVKYIDEWFCAYEKQSHPFLIEVCHAPTPVDACYEMIIRLNELKLL